MNGAVSVRRYSMIMPGGTFSGYIAVQVPENASKIYTDEAVRQMFASAVDPQGGSGRGAASAIAFKVTDLADFKNVRTLAAGARRHSRRRR